MKTETSFVARSHEENWLPILQLAVEEVFRIMLNCQVEPAALGAHQVSAEFTGMVGLAGALSGVLTVRCSAKTAYGMAKSMLGTVATSDEEVADALGEVCNMIAGNFKNKLAGTDERCLLSVPSVICGGQYTLRSLAEGNSLESVVLFEDAPVAVRLQLES